MPEKDKIEALIGVWKLVLAILAAADISLIGWLALHYEAAIPWQSYGGFALVIVLTTAIVWIAWQLFALVERLGKL